MPLIRIPLRFMFSTLSTVLLTELNLLGVTRLLTRAAVHSRTLCCIRRPSSLYPPRLTFTIFPGLACLSLFGKVRVTLWEACQLGLSDVFSLGRGCYLWWELHSGGVALDLGCRTVEGSCGDASSLQKWTLTACLIQVAAAWVLLVRLLLVKIPSGRCNSTADFSGHPWILSAVNYCCCLITDFVVFPQFLLYLTNWSCSVRKNCPFPTNIYSFPYLLFLAVQACGRVCHPVHCNSLLQ